MADLDSYTTVVYEKSKQMMLTKNEGDLNLVIYSKCIF